MSEVDLLVEAAGDWDCVTRTPMGEQRGTFTVLPDAQGAGFSGVLANELGTLEFTGGTIADGELRWTMEMTRPMPMTLQCRARIEGDQLKGSARAGVFGAMPISGVRRSGLAVNS